MNEYWHSLITEKSWKILQELKSKFDFVLIGGWAIYLWTNGLKSKDIDIIVDFNVLERLKKEYELRKNDALKKYEIIVEEIDIDIYVPYFSRLGIPVEDIEAESSLIEGFKVANKEILLIMKQIAESSRNTSEKGEKDRIDILSILFFCDFDFKKYLILLKKYNKEEFYAKLLSLLKNFKDYKYFAMTPRQFKLKKNEILNKIKKP